MALNAHPLKASLHHELHNRQFPQIRGNVALSHITVIHEGEKQAQQQHLADIARQHGVPVPATDSACYYQDFGEIDIRWEYHTEFSTYTFIRFNLGETPFQTSPWQRLAPDWTQHMPGKIISAVHMDTQDFVPFEKVASHIPPDSKSFTQCRVYTSNAELYCTQEPDDNGFEHILLNRRGLCLMQTGRIIRCVLELFSYRMMGLLALPTCKDLLPEVTTMEQTLANISLQLSDPHNNVAAQRKIQSDLSALSARLESTIANHQFRLEASLAYFQIVHHRITELQEKPIDKIPVLADYLNRRLTPAQSTCQSIKVRMLNLSERIDKASDLMRTRINLDVEAQNQCILKAIERRSCAQFRMQQLVESVSIVAVSYYLVQLLGYMVMIPESLAPHINEEVIIAGAVPITLIGVWLCFRRLRNYLNNRE